MIHHAISRDDSMHGAVGWNAEDPVSAITVPEKHEHQQ